MASSVERSPLAILSAPGSRGDVNPMIAIGARLRSRGFDVAVSLAEPYAELAAAAGLEPFPLINRQRFDELLGTAEVWQPLSGLRTVLSGAASEFLRPHFDLIRRLRRPGRTVLVSHPLDFASRIHRDLDPKTPLVDVLLSPAMVRSLRSPPRITPWWFEPRYPPWLMAISYRIGDYALLDRYLSPCVNRLRRELGLPPVRRIMDRWWLSPDRVLSLYPEWFGPTPPSDDGRWQACGFPLRVNRDRPIGAAESIVNDRRDPETGGPAPTVAGGRRPIFFTPGTAHRHARAFFRESIEACQTLDMPGVLATTHRANLPNDLPPGIRGVGYVDLATTLPGCAAIVHHGGIGTTAQAIAAGCPQVIMPMAFDQFHNAERVVQLGLGQAVLGRSLLNRSSPGLIAALASVTTDATINEACRGAADRLTGRDGADVAAEQISELGR